MPSHSFSLKLWASIALAGLAHAHMAPFHPAMYCINGTTPGVVNLNNDAPVLPLYQLSYKDFWMHHMNRCDEFPPDEGVFLDMPAGGSFTVEIAANRAVTSLNPGAKVTNWGDGQNHPDDYSMSHLGGIKTHSGCIPSPNLHAQNRSMAAGTAFALSWESDIRKVTPENLVVVTTAYNTPYNLKATYRVPKGLPTCPPKGCVAVFLWIPNGCGEPNMYMFPYRARVINHGTQKKIGVPKPAVWCEDDPRKCVKGPKQMIIWNQLERNNIEVSGYDLSGSQKSPAYNAKCGFKDGAQNDIFVESHSKRMVKRRENWIDVQTGAGRR